MGVFARKDSKFWYCWLDGAPKPRVNTGVVIGTTAKDRKKSRVLAEQIYHRLMDDRARRRFGIAVDRPVRNFADHRTWYAEHVSAHKGGVVKELSMMRKLGAFFDAYALAEIDQALAREWRTWRRRTVKASTITREEEILKHMLNQAVPKYLERNPLAGMHRLRREDTETRILTPEEERRLLAAATNPMAQAVILCGLDALMRRGSVAKLLRAQDHGAYLTLLNAKAGTYKVPVSVRLRKALDDVATGGPSFFALTTMETAALFEDACARADVTVGRETGGVTFHALRHTGASRMLAAGVDIKTVMRIGGWKNLTVLERYLHPTDAAAQAAVNTIEAQKRPRRLTATTQPRTVKAVRHRKIS